MSDPVQLPAIGGGAAAVTTANASALLSEGMSIGGPERFPAGVGQENPYMKAGTQPTLRIASHRGVLESQGHNRGRGDRREKQSRENSRERSRRCDRTNKEDPRRGGSSTVGVAETEYKKPKLDHDRKSDELMDAQGPPVFDLTQQDDDDENDTTVPPREKDGAGLGPYKHFDKHQPDEGITAPTPALGPAPATPLTHLVQQQQQQQTPIPPPWISDLLDSMATLHRKQDSTHSDVLDLVQKSRTRD